MLTTRNTFCVFEIVLQIESNDQYNVLLRRIDIVSQYINLRGKIGCK